MGIDMWFSVDGRDPPVTVGLTKPITLTWFAIMASTAACSVLHTARACPGFWYFVPGPAHTLHTVVKPVGFPEVVLTGFADRRDFIRRWFGYYIRGPPWMEPPDSNSLIIALIVWPIRSWVQLDLVI